MTKQTKTYTLLIAVLGIWGTIGYQIYQRMNPNVPQIKELKVQNTFQKIPIAETSVYKLREEYRDPFLGGYPKKKITVVNKTSKTPFPNVSYNGTIQIGKRNSYILTINGKQDILKKGDIFEKVKLIKADKEKAVVRFLRETKTILKQ